MTALGNSRTTTTTRDRNFPMNTLRALRPSCVTIFLIVLFACGGGLSETQSPAVSKNSRKWINPCSPDATGTKALPSDVCSFLIETYAEMDKRCGLVPANRFWPPTHWHSYPAYKIIPNEAVMNVKAQLGAAADPFVFSDRVSLATLLTTVTTSGPDDVIKTLINNENGTASHPDPKASDIYKLDFDPRIDPTILNLEEYSASTRVVSCDNALKASENGSVQIVVAKASEKFSAQSDDTQSMKLTSGTFQSSMDWLAQQHSIAFYYEALDLYRRQIQAGTTLPAKLYYISKVDGIVRYLSDKGNAQTDIAASADASYSAGIGGVSGSLSANHSTQNSNSATVYAVLLRNAVTAQLPTAYNVQEYFTYAGSAMFDPGSPLSNEPVFDKKTNKVSMSEAMPGMPSALCKNELWSLPKETAYDLSMSMKEGTSTTTGTANTATSVITTTVKKTRRVCVASASTSLDAFSNSSNFSVRLSFNIDPTQTTPTPLPTATIRGAYNQPDPKLSFLANSLAALSDQGWYQISDPSQIDKTRDPTFDKKGEGISCDKPVTSPVSTVAYSDSYTPPGGNKVRGTFITVLMNFAAQNAPTSCQLNGKLNLTGANGAPITLAVSK